MANGWPKLFKLTNDKPETQVDYRDESRIVQVSKRAPSWSKRIRTSAIPHGIARNSEVA